MDIRSDPERIDERIDDPADTPLIQPVPAPVLEHDSDDLEHDSDDLEHDSDDLEHDSDDDAQPTAASDETGFDQMAQPPPTTASPAPAASVPGVEAAKVQDRWHHLQASFVDDPRDAVQGAHALLEEVTASVRQALEGRIRELQDLWKNTGQHDTEQLRMALRSYRDVMHRLLSLAQEQTTR